MKIQNDKLSIEVDKLGAEIINLSFNDKVLSHNRDPKYWGRNAPVLFPIVGALRDNKYLVDNQEYNLGQHGFGRDNIFELVFKDNHKLTYLLKDSVETKKVYPYSFELYISYELKDNELITTYKIIAFEDMYYQIGAHPAFKVDMKENYKIVMHNSGTTFDLVNGLIGNETSYDKVEFDVNINNFSRGALIYKPNNNHLISILKDNQKYIEMQFDDFELMGVWAPEDKNSPFVCLEPWNGIADFEANPSRELKDKMYIRKLKNNESEEFSFITRFF